jgi:hypothetical protein
LSRGETGGAYIQGLPLMGAYIQGLPLMGAYIQGLPLMGAYIQGLPLMGAYIQCLLPILQDSSESGRARWARLSAG